MLMYSDYVDIIKLCCFQCDHSFGLSSLIIIWFTKNNIFYFCKYNHDAFIKNSLKPEIETYNKAYNNDWVINLH